MPKQSLFQAWNTETLDHLWWWLREDSSAWSLKNNALLLRTLPGTLWGTTNTAKNILLRPEIPVKVGLTSEVTVKNRPEFQGEQAGLIWYNDEANYIKLVKESLEGTVWIVLAREQDDDPALVAKIPVPTDSARLLLIFTGKAVEGWVHPDGGESWSKVGECALVNKETMHPGVFTHGGLADEEKWITFSHFHIYISRK